MKALRFGAAVAVGLAGTLTAGSALAADVYTPLPVVSPEYKHPAQSWTGFHVGIDVGKQFDFTDSSVYSANEHSFWGSWQTLGDDATLGSRSWFISGDVGADYQVNDNFVIGVFANYDWHPSKGKASHSAVETADCGSGFGGGFVCTSTPGSFATINNVNSQFTHTKEVGNTVEYGDAWGVGVRAGILANPKTLVYGLGGYGQKHITAESDFHFGYYNGLEFTGGLSGGGWQPGWFVGAGVETRLGNSNMTLGLEYRHAQYQGFSASCTQPDCAQAVVTEGATVVTNFPPPGTTYQFNDSEMKVGTTSSHTIRARLSFWFGGHQQDAIAVGY